MPADPSTLSRARKAQYFAANLVLRGLLGLSRMLPYRLRIPLMGWIVSRVLSPLAGLDRRVRANLALVDPDMDPAQVARLVRQVPDTAGRYVMELYSGEAFTERARRAPVTGPGLAEIETARAAGRPVILVTGHFGSYDAMRANLIGRGYAMGSLYRRMANPYFNAHYVKAMESMGGRLFEQGRRGMTELVRHLRGGGMVAIVADLHAHGGSELTFFGQPAVTSTVTAELALKYNALLVPIYGVRQPDGLSFVIEAHAPIPHSDPETMMQQVNDDLEAMVRRHMDQWFWIHRRWKPWGNLGLQPQDPQG